MRLTYPRLLCAISVVCGLLGCSGAPSPPSTYPVSGKVTLNGKPVEGANLTFIPKTAGDGATASGSTDAEGNYRLFQGSLNGAQPGSYKVILEAWVPKPGASIPAEMKNDKGQLAAMGLATQVIPTKYVDPAQTDLSADVDPNPAGNTFNFDLVSQ